MTSVENIDCDSSFDFDDDLDIFLVEKQEDELDFLISRDNRKDYHEETIKTIEINYNKNMEIEEHKKNKKNINFFKDIPDSVITSTKRVLFT